MLVAAIESFEQKAQAARSELTAEKGPTIKARHAGNCASDR